MEKEPRRTVLKLVEAAQRDYPAASEILVSFPDKWELVDALRAVGQLLYIGAWPISRVRPLSRQLMTIGIGYARHPH